ncbi:hypothetical protein EYF80_052791 [Liparis tanakae]|uniref:Uncharacterized protein n=1 Tax=Liparis tanakae TaxID=230148 RepID=A0A4Z2F7D4_9TELE|nr:hypothetical protein EYF80_052791 [Liparis tanakae]
MSEVDWQQTNKKGAWFGVQGWATAWRYVQSPSAAFVMNKSSLHGFARKLKNQINKRVQMHRQSAYLVSSVPSDQPGTCIGIGGVWFHMPAVLRGLLGNTGSREKRSITAGEEQQHEHSDRPLGGHTGGPCGHGDVIVRPTITITPSGI